MLLLLFVLKIVIKNCIMFSIVYYKRNVITTKLSAIDIFCKKCFHSFSTSCSSVNCLVTTTLIMLIRLV